MFITFEGGEGAGKSTLSKKVCDELKRTHEVLMTREPGGTPFGEALRHLILHRHQTDSPEKKAFQVCAKAELFLFEAARVQHIEEVIKPALNQAKIVLCDRFSDSTIAYQGAGRALGIDFVKQCDALATGGLKPDLTFFVDIDPEIGLARVRKRSDVKDLIEDEALIFHKRVRAAFQILAQESQGRIVVLDGELSEQELFNVAMTHIQRVL
jgi:dTMP kinase